MICKFNHKFKKWVPIKLAEENTKVITINELKIIYNSHEKNNNNNNNTWKNNNNNNTWKNNNNTWKNNKINK
jgi:hypothetical protein